MIRNTVLYHRFWYVKKRNAARARILFRLGFLAAILALLFSLASRVVLPAVFSALEIEAKSVVDDCVTRAVHDILPASTGGRTSVEASLGLISSRLDSAVPEQLALRGSEISVPLGAVTGFPLLSEAGPGLKTHLRSEAPVRAEIRTEVSDAGNNGTKRSIYLVVYTKVFISLQMLGRPVEIATCVPLSEVITN